MGQSDIGNYDPVRFLDEFNSDQKREEGIRYAVGMLSARDTDRARLLLDQVIDDPLLGQWADEQLAELETRR